MLSDVCIYNLTEIAKCPSIHTTGLNKIDLYNEIEREREREREKDMWLLSCTRFNRIPLLLLSPIKFLTRTQYSKIASREIANQRRPYFT